MSLRWNLYIQKPKLSSACSRQHFGKLILALKLIVFSIDLVYDVRLSFVNIKMNIKQTIVVRLLISRKIPLWFEEKSLPWYIFKLTFSFALKKILEFLSVVNQWLTLFGSKIILLSMNKLYSTIKGRLLLVSFSTKSSVSLFWCFSTHKLHCRGNYCS